MKVIIVDDEKAMHLIMKTLLSKIPNIEILGLFHDTASAALFLNNHTVNIVFLDISMPKESGMQFARRIAKTSLNLHIVFVTSYKEYALDAFDMYVLDYIVKPVSLERLEKTVKKAIDRHSVM
ncbi:response regulator [Paenibacillus psychroresistens]|uniref:Response regulator n=1 Tax=Paenibacillus psychroresistens TaxID=1778678 RepID=A0A6B8RE39_9BACL|nr:response regulator [Paenibacillus psychroresistens]QGQ94197.1 response regulator [Paenibacillus psychroresistens]